MHCVYLNVICLHIIDWYISLHLNINYKHLTQTVVVNDFLLLYTYTHSLTNIFFSTWFTLGFFTLSKQNHHHHHFSCTFYELLYPLLMFTISDMMSLYSFFFVLLVLFLLACFISSRELITYTKHINTLFFAIFLSCVISKTRHL